MRGARKRAGRGVGRGAGRRERGRIAIATGKCSFPFRGAEIPSYLTVADPHGLGPPGLGYGSVRPVSTDDRLSFLRPVSRGFKRGLGRKGDLEPWRLLFQLGQDVRCEESSFNQVVLSEKDAISILVFVYFPLTLWVKISLIITPSEHVPAQPVLHHQVKRYGDIHQDLEKSPCSY
ncbi:hypothetical protein AB1E18_017307 [Capra hircus]